MSGPAGGVASRGRAGDPSRGAARLAGGAAAAAPAILLDRLLRSRAWVVCIGVLLVGIVFFNVGLLELSGGIARLDDRAAALRRQNAALRLEVTRLGSSERIQTEAAALGYVMPAPGEVRYLRARPAVDARRAVDAIAAPAEAVAAPGSSSGSPQTGGPTAPVSPASGHAPPAAAGGGAGSAAGPPTGSPAASSADAPVAAP